MGYVRNSQNLVFYVTYKSVWVGPVNLSSPKKISKHVINSIVPIKWDLVELICVTYKWVWVGPDILCILLTTNLTSNL